LPRKPVIAINGYVPAILPDGRNPAAGAGANPIRCGGFQFFIADARPVVWDLQRETHLVRIALGSAPVAIAESTKMGANAFMATMVPTGGEACSRKWADTDDTASEICGLHGSRAPMKMNR